MNYYFPSRDWLPVAIVSSKNVCKFDKQSNIFRISYDFNGNYDDYGHLRGSTISRNGPDQIHTLFYGRDRIMDDVMFLE